MEQNLLTAFDRYGFPGLIIGVGIVFVFLILRWLAPRAEKLFDSHLTLLGILQEFFTGAGKDIGVIKTFAVNIDEKVRHMDQQVGGLDQKVGAINKRVDHMSTVLVAIKKDTGVSGKAMPDQELEPTGSEA
jgi:hypothetical protein